MVLSIANCSPNLEEIKLTACYDITDACMIALGKCCRQVIFIDIEKCNNISDRGLITYADACCNVRYAVNLLERGDGSGLRKISLSSC